jgi:glucose/arabinose dehydrogenase
LNMLINFNTMNSKSKKSVVIFSAFLMPLASQALEILKGKEAMGDWKKDAPGVMRLITHDDVLAPYVSPSSSNRSITIDKPANEDLKTMEGFRVEVFAKNVDGARVIRQAPNGDIFISQSRPGNVRVGDRFEFQNGKISVIRPSSDGKAVEKMETFLADLKQPYGMAFYPPGPTPQWLYVAMQGQVVRYPYKNGDLKSTGTPEVIVKGLPTGGHWTRDIGFSIDGKTLFLAVGSTSNVAVDMEDRPQDLVAWEKEHGLGAAWGNETDRATVLAFSPDGSKRRVYATGIRNCSGLTVQPTTGVVFCATNERDLMGDNTPPDYVSSIKEGHFYGWPWIYHRDYEDNRPAGGSRPDLRGKATMPDALIQAHSAPLGVDFNPGGMFPAEWTGDAFAALHGSWNRALHTGYKIIRLPAKSNQLVGTYQDLVTGFATGENAVWGRPVNVKFLRDGSMLFSEDVNGTIYRVTYKSP